MGRCLMGKALAVFAAQERVWAAAQVDVKESARVEQVEVSSLCMREREGASTFGQRGQKCKKSGRLFRPGGYGLKQKIQNS